MNCPLCNGEIVETEKVFKCSNQEWSKETGNSGCNFVIFKNNKVFDKEIGEKELEELLNGGKITDSKGNIMELDLDSKFFTKITFNNQSKNKTTDIICPLCKEGNIVETEKVFKCSKQKWTKEEGNTGCPFTIWKYNKLLEKTLSNEDIKTLIEKGELDTEKGVLKLDLNNKFFTNIEFKK